MKKQVVVIGGGIAGTAAAYALQRQGLHVTIVEKENRIGGRIYSQIIDDQATEMGAGFISESYRNILAFIDEVGLKPKVRTRKSAASILRDGVAYPLDLPATWLTNKWLSFGARVYLAKELFAMAVDWRMLDIQNMSRASRLDTESVAEHFKGKYGREVLDYLIAPGILDSYLYWSPDLTSQAAAMIVFKFILMKRHTFILEDGLSQIPLKAAQGSKVLLAHEVSSIEQNKITGAYSIVLQSASGMSHLKADGIVCATTADAVSHIFRHMPKSKLEFFKSVSYSSTIVVAANKPNNGTAHSYAVAYPRNENIPVTALTAAVRRAANKQSIKIYASGSLKSEWFKMSDNLLASHFATSVNMNDNDTWRVQRWERALPLFAVGRIKDLMVFNRGEIEDPKDKLVYAGDYLGGPYIEGAFTSGVAAAQRLMARLK